jgi:hypothetical protein
MTVLPRIFECDFPAKLALVEHHTAGVPRAIIRGPN